MGGRNRRADTVYQRGDLSIEDEVDKLTQWINEETRLLKKHLHLPIVSNDYNFHMFDYL